MAMKSTSDVLAQVRGVVDDARDELLSMVPTAVGDHLAAVKKELLAAVREVVDEETRRTDSRWESAKARKGSRKSGPDTPESDSAPDSATT